MERHEDSRWTTEAFSGADLARLLREVSHELRSPLGSIVIWIRLAQEDPDPAERVRALTRILHGFESLSAITAEMSDCAALLEGRFELQMLPGDLTPVLDLAVQRLADSARRRKVAVELEADRAAVRISMDRDRLGRALEALIGHAVMCRAPEPVLPVRLSRTGTTAIIEAPLGESGFASITRLAERLQTPPARGAVPGLTLPLAVEILALHGGRVGRSRGPGEPTMTIELPIA